MIWGAIEYLPQEVDDLDLLYTPDYGLSTSGLLPDMIHRNDKYGR